MNRSSAREVAMKRLFAHALGGDGVSAYIWTMTQEEAVAQREENARKATEQQLEIQSNTPEKKKIKLSKRDLAFADSIFDGVTIYRDKLDVQIQNYVKEWAMDRLDIVDLCLLRIAVYEIYFCQEIPVAASISETVELAKQFGGEKSSSFINGVLGSFARSNDGERPILSFREDTATAASTTE